MVIPLPNEPELLKRCAKGNTEAFGALVSHYQDAIYNVAYRMLGHREDARDVTQEVFVKAFRKIRSFEARASFSTWLYSIALRQAINHRRHMGAQSRAGSVQMSSLGCDAGEHRFDAADDGPSPDAPLLAVETQRQIEKAIERLSDDYRAAVVLRDVEGLGYERIADILGCSLSTVKSRLHRARLELRRTLKTLINA
jgi:RNA polymerase sigma-70 factor, ECF subfamily